MDYKFHYDKLIDRARNRKLDTYTEEHHIVPKCMGGLDDQENLVNLTAEEHFVAHQLLAKIFPTNYGIISAAVNMVAGNQYQKRNNKLYGWLRRKYSESKKGQTKENNSSVRQMAEKLRGRTKETHEYIRISADKKRGRTKETNPGLKKMADTLSGRTKETHEYLASAAVKKAGRTKETHLGVKRQAEKMTGRTKETHNSVRKMANTLRGRTKETHAGVKLQAESLRGRCKLNAKFRIKLEEMRDSGEKFTDISKNFKENGVNINADGLRKIYIRIKEGYNFKDDSIPIRPNQNSTDQNNLT